MDDDALREQARTVVRLVEQVRPVVFPLLAGHPPMVQGAAIADLTATWIAGHVSLDGPEATAELRERLLAFHVEAIRELVAINAKDG